jgi:integrase/recombinase XerD
MARSLTVSQAFQGMILEKRAAGLSIHTISDYQNTLKKVLLYFPNDPPLASVTRERLVKFFAWLSDDYIAKPDGAAPRGQFKLGAKSRLNIHTNLSALWTWAVASGYVEKNIVRTIPAPNVEETDIDPLTSEEITALVKACDTARTYQLRQAKSITRIRSTAARDRMIIIVLYDTGLRAQELCDLIIDDLNFSQNKIKVRHGKGNKPRTVRFGKRAAKAIWEYLKDRIDTADPKEPLLRVDEGQEPRPMSRHILRRLVKRIGDRAGVKNVHPHRLRHSFATEYLRNNGKMLALQELLGHSDLEMVRRYAKFVEADIALDHAEASPADKLRL